MQKNAKKCKKCKKWLKVKSAKKCKKVHLHFPPPCIILGCAHHCGTPWQGFTLVFLKEGEAVLSEIGKLATRRSRFGALLQAPHRLHWAHNLGGGGAFSVKEALASPQTVHNRLTMVFNLKNPLSLNAVPRFML